MEEIVDHPKQSTEKKKQSKKGIVTEGTTMRDEVIAKLKNPEFQQAATVMK